jgi:hypothetical protein
LPRARTWGMIGVKTYAAISGAHTKNSGEDYGSIANGPA